MDEIYVSTKCVNIAIAASQMDASTTTSPDPFTDIGGAKTTDTDGDRAQEGTELRRGVFLQRTTTITTTMHSGFSSL